MQIILGGTSSGVPVSVPVQLRASMNSRQQPYRDSNILIIDRAEVLVR